MKLVVTIDVEEDNWGSCSLTDNTIENIKKIPSLQALFDEFHVKPTYLLTYPVARDEKAMSLFKEILRTGRCEIGTHCHPWNTPPFVEKISRRNSMLCNLPVDLQYRKIQSLHETITANFGEVPVSFRAGRWGFSREVARNLIRLGYKIDTSVTPYVDWTDYYGANCANMSPMPFRISGDHIGDQSASVDLLEVPATIGFLQTNFPVSNYVFTMLSRRPFRHLRFIGILDRLRLLNKVWLSPEVSDSKSMIGLVRSMLANRASIINMTIHSPCLQAGLTPYTRDEEGVRRLMTRIEELLIFVRKCGVESIRLSEAQNLV